VKPPVVHRQGHGDPLCDFDGVVPAERMAIGVLLLVQVFLIRQGGAAGVFEVLDDGIITAVCATEYTRIINKAKLSHTFSVFTFDNLDFVPVVSNGNARIHRDTQTNDRLFAFVI
jgi:hypothetical protein